MNSRRSISLILPFALITLLISVTPPSLYAQGPASAYVTLDAVQLDQLVAPIALDPDSVVAQTLTAATFPDQVAAADSWLSENMNLRPEERAAGANTMPWDPAVKALIEFPAVLDNMAKNAAWTAQLGNAYFNQPGDVMNAVQATRAQAQASKVLVETPQQHVVVDAGVISIVPVNPAVVFVPYYNPWRVWGPMFVAYPGFVVLPPPPGIVIGFGLVFDAGIPIRVFAGFDWGFAAWAPVWDGGIVLFHHDTYISRSVTVINHGHFGGHDCGAFEHGGRGVPQNFHAAAHSGTAQAAASRANRAGVGGQTASNHSGLGSHSRSANSGFGNHTGSSSSAANRSSFGNRSGSSMFAGRGSSPAQSAANRSNFGSQNFGNHSGVGNSPFGSRSSAPTQMASNRSSFGNRPGFGNSLYGNRNSSLARSGGNQSTFGNRSTMTNSNSGRNFSNRMSASNRSNFGGRPGFGSAAGNRGNFGGRSVAPARSFGGGRSAAPARGRR